MDSGPTNPLSRRSFSLPAIPASRGPSSPDPQIEILYTLSFAKIVSFTTPHSTSGPNLSGGSSSEQDEVGKLSWFSRYESTIALGPLRIYRAPGSVAFLNCATALKPILPKSQAWCVDGDSKFVLQIRPPQYWRIEVSNASTEDKLKVDELKKVFGEILLFEKTPCPFQRDFTVELPEAPKTPIIKRPWKPSQGPRTELLPTPEAWTEIAHAKASVGKRASSSSPLRQSAASTARRRNSDIDAVTSQQQQASDKELPLLWKPPRTSSPNSPTIISEASESCDIPYPRTPSPKQVASEKSVLPSSVLVPEERSNSMTDSLSAKCISTGTTGLDDGNTLNEIADDMLRGKNIPPSQASKFDLEPERIERPQAIQNCTKTLTAPPVLSLVTSPPSKHMPNSPRRLSSVSETDSRYSSSVESFHTVQSWHSPLAPPSPATSEPRSPAETYPYPHENIALPKRRQHTRDASELTITAEPSQVWDLNVTPCPDRTRRPSTPEPKTPTLINDGSEKSDEEQFEVVTPPTIRQALRHRATTSSNSRRRQLSPLPPAANLFSPTRRQPRRQQTGRHLPTAIIQKTCEILLSPPSHLLHIMLNIASKIATGEWREFLSWQGEAVHWDFEDEYEAEAWFEDDYGISIPNPPRENKKALKDGGSWEVD